MAAFFACGLLVAPWLNGPPTCRDGWASGSIGRQGACSHHGGVGSQKLSPITLAVSLAVGALAGCIAARGRKVSVTCPCFGRGWFDLDEPTNMRDPPTHLSEQELETLRVESAAHAAASAKFIEEELQHLASKRATRALADKRTRRPSSTIA